MRSQLFQLVCKGTLRQPNIHFKTQLEATRAVLSRSNALQYYNVEERSLSSPFTSSASWLGSGWGLGLASSHGCRRHSAAVARAAGSRLSIGSKNELSI